MHAKPVVIAAVLLLCSIEASASPAPSYQQGSKLVAAGTVGNPALGWAAALSADGNTAIVGGISDNSGAGAAWVYARSGGVWNQQGAKLVGTGAVGTASQGYSVSLSADGNTAIVGGYNDNTSAGAAWVYTRSGGVWSQQGSKLVGTGAVGPAQQGGAVALSADGNTAIVGGAGDNSNEGAAWVYTRSGGVWSQQGAKLVGTGAAGNPAQGQAVALSADGNTAVVSGWGDNGGTGAVWVYTRSGGVWSQQGSKLVGTGAVGNADQGESVALSGDGNTAVVGGYSDNGSAGAAWVYIRSGGVWSQQGSKLVGTGAVGNAGQGKAVALSADGNTAVVGGYNDNGSAGAAWVYTRSGGVWSQQGSKLVGTGAVGIAFQGNSVALSADGGTAIVGGYHDNSAGAAWVFIDPAPTIVSLTDVPNDQGGHVNLRWTASLLDNAPTTTDPISAYWIWRQVPSSTALSALPASATLPKDAAVVESSAGRKFRVTRNAAQVYYWEYVGSQVSHGFPAYSYTAPTSGDSIPGSNPYTYFMVEAEQPTVGLYWQSAPDSGYSVDNLPPGAPAIIAAAYQTGATHLHWSPNSESDFSLYRIYRGNSAGFVPGTGNLIASQPDTGYADSGPAGSYYKISAVDIHGNESAFTLLTPAQTSGVGPPPAPGALALAPPWPNPARERALLSFAVPAAGPVTLAVYDLGGRRVRTLAQGPLAAGEYEVRFDLRDGAGRTVPRGLYFVRLEAGGRTLVRRLAIVQ